MAIPRNGIAECVEAVLLIGAKKATKYISERETIKATFQGKRDKRARQQTVILTVGRPNYKEREFIKQCKKAGEPFPVKKIQLKFPAKPR